MVRIVRNQAGYSLIEIMVVVGIIGVVSAIAVPMMTNSLKDFRLTGDIRGISNGTATAKMRAASTFTRVRLYVDLTTGAHHMEWLDTSVSPAHWTMQGGSTYLSTGVSFGSGSAAAPPSSTQGLPIRQAPKCTADDGSDIDGTACIIFNSRGVPIDGNASPTAVDAIWLTDGTTVYGVTVSATGMVRTWRTQPNITSQWLLQ